MISSESPIIILSFKILTVLIRVELIRVIEALEDTIIISLTHITILRILLLKNWPLFSLSGLISIIVIVDLLQESSHASTLGLLLSTLVFLFLFSHALVIVLQPLDLVFA